MYKRGFTLLEIKNMKMNMQKKNHKFLTGFTLLEMITALAVFSSVLVVVLTGYLNILNMQRSAEAARAVYDNIDFAMEVMSREIRTGYDYCIISNWDNTCNLNQFFFKSGTSGNPEIVYSLNGIQIQANKNGGQYFELTSPNVIVTKLEFIVSGQGSGDNKQPTVTIIIQAEADIKGVKSQINIQTTVVQRNSDS